MIILKKMKWSNFFSYGENNEIDFDKSTLTQIAGENGSGKSSIVLILEEILFGKNFKNIKKGDIPNWNITNPILNAELDFEVDDITYKISYQRRTSIKLSLYANGKDISGHTSTQTYREIENILGINYKTFGQLIYQSSKNSLQFLTTTDTSRKEFLISLFGLEEYSKYLDIYKNAARDLTSAKSKISGEIKSLDSFITKYSAMSFIKQKLKEVPEEPTELIKELGEKEKNLKNIASINSTRNKNNTYKNMLEKIDITKIISVSAKPTDISEDISKKNILIAENKNLEAEIKTLSAVGEGSCPKCRQTIDSGLIYRLILEDENKLKSNRTIIGELEEKISKNKKELEIFNKNKKEIEEFEKLSNLIDNSLETELLNSDELKKEIEKLKNEINEINAEIKSINTYNNKAAAHNSKIDIITKQLEEHREQLKEAGDTLKSLEKVEINVDILKKAFSNTGLVAFKLEYLAKTLESEINRYLSILSDGQFVLEFVLEAEKLNIKLTNNGKETNMVSLSSGQEARVNTATLLAIRKMMSNISGSKINLLILDEVLGVLDKIGKETLIELLLEENDLNTFLVDHSYSHPLLASLYVENNKGISKITES